MTVLSLRNRITDNPGHFDANRRSDQSLILVEPMPSDHAERVRRGAPFCDRDLEINLTVGARWASFLAADRPQMLSIDEHALQIAPFDAVVIETEQQLSIPNNVFGVVFPKSGLVHRTGLAPLTTKIDPTFVGRPLILVQNLSNTKRTLTRGDRLASVAFLHVGDTVVAPRSPQTPLESGSKGVAFTNVSRVYLNSAVVSITASAALSSLITVLITRSIG